MSTKHNACVILLSERSPAVLSVFANMVLSVWQAELEEREERRRIQELREQERKKEEEKERLQEQKEVSAKLNYSESPPGVTTLH